MNTKHCCHVLCSCKCSLQLFCWCWLLYRNLHAQGYCCMPASFTGCTGGCQADILSTALRGNGCRCINAMTQTAGCLWVLLVLLASALQSRTSTQLDLRQDRCLLLSLISCCVATMCFASAQSLCWLEKRDLSDYNTRCLLCRQFQHCPGTRRTVLCSMLHRVSSITTPQRVQSCHAWLLAEECRHMVCMVGW
jgi:hypothetical protein